MNTKQNVTDELFDYLLVVDTDVLVKKEVTRIRQSVASELKNSDFIAAPVHVALFRSAFPERFQEDFIMMLEEVARKQAGFAVYTSKMDFFRHADGNNRVFINVANPKPLIDLHHHVMKAFELKPQLFKPHIMLAKGLNDIDLHKILPMLLQQVFVRSFNCHCFTLLKRLAAGGKYERVKDFTFGDIEHITGSLFKDAA